MQTLIKISLFILLILQLSYSSALAQDKKAFIVAISKYHEDTAWQNLNSHNDLSLIESALLSQGFERDDIIVLTDSAATKEGIISGFNKHLIDKVSQGDIAYFHFSGHGQQVQDFNGDELDGYDESLVPFNAGSKFKPGIYEGEKHLVDDEVRQLYNTLRLKLGPEGHFLCTIDACHSGTSTRGLSIARGTVEQMADSNYVAGRIQSNDADVDQFELEVNLDSLASMVALFGALPHQLNYELTGEDGNSYGSLSYAFCQSLNELETGATYRSLFDRIKLIMSKTSRKQLPESEGMLDQAVFGGEFLAEPNYALVDRIRNDSVVNINAGFLKGFRLGSIIGFYPKETREIEAVKPIVTGTISKSGANKSRVLLDRPISSDSVQNTWALINVESFGDLKVNIKIDDLGEYTESVKNNLESFNFIEFTDEDADLYLMKDDNKLSLIGAEDIHIKDFDLSMSPVALNRNIRLTIISFTQAEFIRGLEQKNKKIAVEFEFVPVVRNTDDPRTFDEISIDEKLDRSETIRFKENDLFKLKVTNYGDTTAYYSVLDIQPDNIINVIVPYGSLTATDCSIRSGESKIVDLTFKIAKPYGQELYKLVSSREPIDLRSIAGNQGETRGSRTHNPFEKLFSSSYLGNSDGTRGSMRLPKGQVNIYTKPFIIEK